MAPRTAVRNLDWVGRFSPMAIAATAAVALAALIPGAGAATASRPANREAVERGPSVGAIVQAAPDAMASAERAIQRAGGHVVRRLGVINGFAAQVPAGQIARLRAVPGVVGVSLDRVMRPKSVDPSLGYDAAADTGSLQDIAQIVNAPAVWQKGFTGAGVSVAVIDTGITKVPGLDQGQVIDGPDLSFDSQSADLANRDSFGHGTHLASIIAGRDPNMVPPAYASQCPTCKVYGDPTSFNGIAPDAELVNVKVGATDGAADVSQVIAAIDWVVQHKDDLKIKVINLAFGTNSQQDSAIDPLAYAAEQAWKHGIVVVAAAGNDGTAVPTLSDPAYDPYVLAVGSSDPNGTVDMADDTVPPFATRSTTKRNVDIIAPGTHVLGLRVPGSYVDSASDNTGQVGSRFQRGSGTSQSTAVVAGVVALLEQANPGATPDQIKDLVRSTGHGLDLALGKPEQGRGVIDAAKAIRTKLKSANKATQTFPNATGVGSLDAARGGVYVADNGVDLRGEYDIFGAAFDSAAMATAEANGASWTGGTWNGSRWTGDWWTWADLTGIDLASASWAGVAWTGDSWQGLNWLGTSWLDFHWSGASWTGTSWAGSRWSGSRWSDMAWDGSRWSGVGWNGSRWTGSRWSSTSWSGYGWK